MYPGLMSWDICHRTDTPKSQWPVQWVFSTNHSILKYQCIRAEHILLYKNHNYTQFVYSVLLYVLFSPKKNPIFFKKKKTECGLKLDKKSFYDANCIWCNWQVTVTKWHRLCPWIKLQISLGYNWNVWANVSTQLNRKSNNS